MALDNFLMYLFQILCTTPGIVSPNRSRRYEGWENKRIKGNSVQKEGSWNSDISSGNISNSNHAFKQMY